MTEPTSRNTSFINNIRRIEGLEPIRVQETAAATEATPSGPSGLHQQGGGHPVSFPTEPSATRRAEIDQFVADKANDTPWHDDNGGEHVGSALVGDSDLGRLTVAEKNYLAQQAVEAWIPHQRSETLREAAELVEDDPTARRALADAMSRPAAAQTRLEEVACTLHDPGSERYRLEMLEHAVSLDATKVIQNFEGVETQLGEFAIEEMGRQEQEALLRSVAAGRVDDAGADRLVTSMFFHADASHIRRGEMAPAMAAALARVTHPDLPSGDTSARQIMETRLTEILETSGGRELLFGREIHPDLRAWALDKASNDPTWTAEALSDGWESDIVTTTYAEEVAGRYAGLGPEPMELSGEALRTAIGQSIGLPPTLLPSDTETDAERSARLEAGLDHPYYAADARIDLIAEHIQEYGGENARVSVVPVVVTTEDHGATVHNVFRVESDEGVHFVDDQGLKYDNLAAWEDEARLPKGRMTYPAGLEPGAELVDPRNTPAVVDTFWEHAGRVGDAVALGVGIVAGVAIVVGTGGTAALVAAGVSGGYAASRAGAQLHDDAQRGIDITDLSNPQVRSNWIDLAAGAFSVAAIGGGLRLANSARQGVQVTNTAARTLATTQLVAEGLDLAAVANQAHGLVTNWDQLSNGERAAGLLEVAFWGGMTAASARSGGGTLRDGMSLSRLDNLYRTGTPYPIEQVPGLSAGEIQVSYQTVNGRVQDITIQTGAGPVDPAALVRHTNVARNMEQAGGLTDRLRVLLGGETVTPGTAAWEAQLEIGKINAEARDIADQLATPGLSGDQIARLETRQTELAREIAFQDARLGDFNGNGRGFIAQPSEGSIRARELGWAEAPDGHQWIGTTDGEPVLFQDDGSVPVHEFDPISGEFTDRYRRGEQGSLNPELNPPRGQASAGLEPNSTFVYDNGQTYTTNGEGHVARVDAQLSLDGWVRDPSSQARYGNIGSPSNDFDGGHLIARMFGGSPDRINVVPQNSYLNQHGSWRQKELEWEAMLRADPDIDLSVRIDVIYPPEGGAVPEAFRVTQIVDGVVETPEIIYNTRSGTPTGN